MGQAAGKEKVSFLPLSHSLSINQTQINGHCLASSPVEGTATATKVLKIQVMEKIKGKYAIYSKADCVSKACRLRDCCDPVSGALWSH